MRLLIIRHGDPDYSIDSLTEKGKREVQLLKERLSKLDVKAVYCSPLGRARDTVPCLSPSICLNCYDSAIKTKKIKTLENIY